MTPKMLCLQFELEQWHAVREFSTTTVKALKPEIVPPNGGKKDKRRIFQNYVLKACMLWDVIFNKFPSVEGLELIPKVHFMFFILCVYVVYISLS